MYNGGTVETATVEVKTKQVGNSLVILIPAEIRAKMGLKPNEGVIAHIHKAKKKNKKQILSLFGALRGTKLMWSCEEDRYNEWRD
jgi:bifunctional DNA-binding transcriptional regulator/antitoxin component of YhaV-PrlF toxin-antitoxin module